MSVIKRDLLIAMGSRTSEPLMVAAEEKKEERTATSGISTTKKKTQEASKMCAYKLFHFVDINLLVQGVAKALKLENYYFKRDKSVPD